MNFLFRCCLFLLLCLPVKSFCQAGFYSIDSIQEIKIYFTQSNWDHILDSLYVDGEEERLEGEVEINGQYFKGVGIRYKGFSSVSITRRKNPFNIKLNYTINGQRYDGIDKIKLSNVINDPSFVREVYSYEVARKYMPASRANFARVYVNDTLLGLYSNVEAVNNEFLSDRFDFSDGPLIKCNPENLDFGGENSNLGNAYGNNPEDYHPFYDLKSDSGWEDLYYLIDTLNEHEEYLEEVLNIDQTIWMHAFNYVLVNFDSYIGYAQNYYLFKGRQNRFQPILWDLNMSLGSFRFSDASTYWRGFNIEQAKTIDPFAHHSGFSVIPRPLIRNILQNDRYRKMYVAHMRTILDENFSNGEYISRCTKIQDDIESAVLSDTNKFYSDSDFRKNLDSTTSAIIEYPGIKDLMQSRVLYLNTLEGFQGFPEITEIKLNPEVPRLGDDLVFNLKTGRTDSVFLAYRQSEDERFQIFWMQDDGQGMDTLAGDGVFTYKLTNASNYYQYYFFAENDSSGSFSPPRAAYEFYELRTPLHPSDLVINEFMASNNGIYLDDENEADDWIEIYNATESSISLWGLELSHKSNADSDTTFWAFPNKNIGPGEYEIVWADDDEEQAGLHASFKLDADGGSLTLQSASGTTLSTIDFDVQDPISSFGRYPNANGPFKRLQPTFNQENQESDEAFLTKNLFLYPNPASDQFNLIVDTDETFDLSVYDLTGKLMYEDSDLRGKSVLNLSALNYSNGVYLVELSAESFNEMSKLVISKL